MGGEYKYKLTEDQTSVPGKGLNFAFTPDKPVEEFIIDTEQACRLLPNTKSEQLRSQVAGIMKTAKQPKPNINRKERQALAELKKKIIRPADKGKATVSMDTDEYK